MSELLRSTLIVKRETSITGVPPVEKQPNSVHPSCRLAIACVARGEYNTAENDYQRPTILCHTIINSLVLKQSSRYPFKQQFTHSRQLYRESTSLPGRL
jgi:hypothetical protein